MKINFENNYTNLDRSYKNDDPDKSVRSVATLESSDEMQRMQQEAMKRVHDMQNRARRTLDAGRQYEQLMPTEKITEPRSEKEKNNSHSMPTTSHNFHTNRSKTQNAKKENNFNILKLLTEDSEKSLILFLILLLVEEKADMDLIFALMYLII